MKSPPIVNKMTNMKTQRLSKFQTVRKNKRRDDNGWGEEGKYVI